MFLTTHAAAGIAISTLSANPLAVFGFSFLSHFILDFIPHGDENLYHDDEWKTRRRYRRVLLINALDLGALTGLVIWAVTQANAPGGQLLTIGILGSILPDFLSYFFPIIHQRFSWLFLMRWLYAVTKPTGLRYLVRGQNRLHRLLHDDLIRRDVPLPVGIALQVVCIVLFLSAVT